MNKIIDDYLKFDGEYLRVHFSIALNDCNITVKLDVI